METTSPTREQINTSAASYGYRLRTEAERIPLMIAEHEKMARIFTRVGQHEQAASAEAMADALRA